MNGSGPTLAATPKEEIEEVDQDKAFLEHLKVVVLTDTTVMSEKEMNDLPVTRHLGEGSFGTVDLVTFKGRDAIRKAIKNGGDLTEFLWEAHVTLEMDGAGGAPRLHALSTEPASAVMDYAGVPLYRILNGGCPMGTFLRIVADVAKSLDEVHAKGYLHNDIKSDNITVTGYPSNPCVHVIDFGLATLVDDSFYFELFDLPRCLKKQKQFVFRSPELKKGEPLQPSSDVFSIGVMLRDVCVYMKHQRLYELLWPLVEACTQELPEDRPPLSKVWQDVQDMLSILTDTEEKHVLGEEDEEETFPALSTLTPPSLPHPSPSYSPLPRSSLPSSSHTPYHPYYLNPLSPASYILPSPLPPPSPFFLFHP